MSMSIDGPMNNFTSALAQRHIRESAVKPPETDRDRLQFVEKLEQLKTMHVESAGQRRRQQLEDWAERLATRTEAIAARFEEIGARWSERFADLEAKAQGRNDLGAERIAEISEKLTKQLDDVSENIVSQLDLMSERIGNMLTESYGAISNDLPNPEDPEVDVVA